MNGVELWLGETIWCKGNSRKREMQQGCASRSFLVPQNGVPTSKSLGFWPELLPEGRAPCLVCMFCFGRVFSLLQSTLGGEEIWSLWVTLLQGRKTQEVGGCKVRGRSGLWDLAHFLHFNPCSLLRHPTLWDVALWAPKPSQTRFKI